MALSSTHTFSGSMPPSNSFQISIMDDNVFEDTETFTVTAAGTYLDSQITATATVTIIDNDGKCYIPVKSVLSLQDLYVWPIV